MTMTIKEAAKKKCPLARTFSEKSGPNCEVDLCILWRWVPMGADDPHFVKAVRAEMARLVEGAGKEPMTAHQKAVANVMADKVGHGLPEGPDRGYCGLGGA